MFKLFVIVAVFFSSLAKAQPEFLWVKTNMGEMLFELRADWAPKHVQQIKKLTKLKIYDGMDFHRLHQGFVLQVSGADQNLSRYTSLQKKALKKIPAEFSKTLKHKRGMLSMARWDSDINSAESSFSIMFGSAPHLDSKYTLFGQIKKGQKTLQAIEAIAVDKNMRPLKKLYIKEARIIKDLSLVQIVVASTTAKQINDFDQYKKAKVLIDKQYVVTALILSILLLTLIAIFFCSRGKLLYARSLLYLIYLLSFLILYWMAGTWEERPRWLSTAMFLSFLATFKFMNFFERPVVEKSMKQDEI